MLGHRRAQPHTAFYMDIGDQNPGLNVYIGSTLYVLNHLPSHPPLTGTLPFFYGTMNMSIHPWMNNSCAESVSTSCGDPSVMSISHPTHVSHEDSATVTASVSLAGRQCVATMLAVQTFSE